MWRTSTKTLYCWRPKPYLCHQLIILLILWSLKSVFSSSPSSFDQYRHHYNCEVNGWMEVTLCAPKVASHCVLLNLSSTRSLFRYPMVHFGYFLVVFFYDAWDKYWWPRWKILRMKVKNIDDEGKKYWWWWWQILMMIVTNIDDDGEKYWHASVCQTVCAATKQARPQFGVMRPNELWHQGTNLCRPFLEAAYWKNLIKDSFWAKMRRVISARYPL